METNQESGAIDISPKQDKGVLKEIIKPGVGDDTPSLGHRVSVHYTGRLLNGKKFDSSIDRGELFTFALGRGHVIKGWEIGIATMKKGEKCLLTCKSEYGYGKEGSPPHIPEDATLVFELELFSWLYEDLTVEHDSGILRKIIKEGVGYAMPSEGSIVEVHLIGWFEGQQFEERNVTFELGEGSEVGIVNGLESSLLRFQKAEKAKIILASKYAFGAEGKPELNIPPHANVEYEVTLLNFEKEKENWLMCFEEKIEMAEIAKSKGTNFFKEGNLKKAYKHYKKISHYLQFDSLLKGEDKEMQHSLMVAGYLNMAACSLKTGEYEDVINNCDEALKYDPNNAKGLFRKGQVTLTYKV